MKQKLLIIFGIVFLVVILVGLNAASYTQKEKEPDSEWWPNRSTFNPGATGTQAFYTLLSESGRRVSRWQEPPSALKTLKTDKKDQPSVFVVIGSLRRKFTPPEIEDLLQWVATGGKLVVIDRDPPKDLVTTTANWKINFLPSNRSDILRADPTDQKQMTDGTQAIKPVQPTYYGSNVNAIQPSRFAATITFERVADSELPKKKGFGRGSGSGTAPPPKATPSPAPTEGNDNDKDNDEDNDLTYFGGKETNTNKAKDIRKKDEVRTPFVQGQLDKEKLKFDKTDISTLPAPSAHFGLRAGNLLIEAPYNGGRIVYLSDPYIVSNAGIGIVDNAQLGINIVSAPEGTIVFDEYHQGYGTNNNRFLQFFEGTPVVAIFLQGIVMLGFIFFSQSRRFARAVPESEPDRLSKLEYVSAMAELQQRTRAYDLAIENIYTDFRRRAARSLGVDNFTTSRSDLAKLIAGRTTLDAAGVEDILFKCEDIIHGEPTNKRQVVELSGALRSLEERLGMNRAKRTGS